MNVIDPASFTELAKLALDAIREGSALQWTLSVLAIVSLFLGARLALKALDK